MRVTVSPAQSLKGAPKIPGDKSISHRALMMGAMAIGDTKVSGLLDSADVRSTADCLRALGVDIAAGHTSTIVRGVGMHGFHTPAATLDCGNSGTTVRLLAGILAGQKFSCALSGDDSLRRRPMKRIQEPLARMGADVQLRDGKVLPLTITGRSPLVAIDYALPVASAQLKSALLLAGLWTDGTTTLRGLIHSRDHTENMLPMFGAEVSRTTETVSIRGGQKLRACDIQVPSDPSTAAFWVAGATLLPGSDVELKNVLLNPTRIGFFTVLSRMGAQIKISPTMRTPELIGTVTIGAAELKGTTVAASEVPSLIDELPLLAVVACFAHGRTEVRGAEELRAKESDRIETVAKNLRAMGATIETRPDGFVIEGPQSLHGARVDSFHDHRIAMAFAIAALKAEKPTEIENAESVAVSYPEFLPTLRNCRVAEAFAVLLGHPLGHSLSPDIFAFLAKSERRVLRYELRDVAPRNLAAELRALKTDPNFVGANVTIPYKQKIAKVTDRCAPVAQVTQAVNVVVNKRGRWIGHNTDVLGIEKTLSEVKCPVRSRYIVVFGAGGAAAAMAYALGALGAAQVEIRARRPAAARALARRMQRYFRHTKFVTQASSPELVALFVNATPVGMKGFPRDRLLPKKLPKSAVAFDLVYRPARTPFMVTAARAGLRTVGGLDMLIWQALATWELWIGPLKNPNSLKKRLKKHLELKL